MRRQERSRRDILKPRAPAGVEAMTDEIKTRYARLFRV
jgi:hypothetical protein